MAKPTSLIFIQKIYLYDLIIYKYKRKMENNLVKINLIIKIII